VTDTSGARVLERSATQHPREGRGPKVAVEARTGSRGHGRRSLAVRITALVITVLVASGLSALVMLRQLRALQTSFDRLIDVYVVFNQQLAEAHVQAVRVHEIIRTHQHDTDGLSPARLDAGDFGPALQKRSHLAALAREPIDDALRNPSRYGGEDNLHELQEIRRSLDELEELVAVDNLGDPARVLEDVQTQNQITQLFKSLSKQSSLAVGELREEVRSAHTQVERLMIVLTAGTSVLGVLAMIGVFLALRPLQQLAQSVRDLSRGDWAQRVQIPGIGRGDEVSQLASEFNLMAEALEERERRLLRGERLAAAGQLAAQITHEIRNPLSSVALNVELLEDELDPSSLEGRHLLGEITREVDRLTQITEEYLGFARRPKPELVPLDLGDQLRGLLEFMRPELEVLGVDVRIDLSPTPVRIHGDPNQLRQAFMNLVRNAQEAALEEECREAERTPLVEVHMRCDLDVASVRIVDNGPGIPLPPESLERIFEAFYTRKARGTGLGLSTVQQILADHGGTVRVERTSSEGTVFEVLLPVANRLAPTDVAADVDELADRRFAP